MLDGIIPLSMINKLKDDVGGTIAQKTEEWLEQNIDPATGYVLDNTLTLDNAAPPASAVGDLKSAFIQLEEDIIEPSINLLNPEEFVVGKYLVSGGGLSDSDSRTASGFFPVNVNTTYHIYRSDTYQVRLCFYTGKDETSYIYNSLIDLSYTTPTFTPPTNAKYARISTNKNMILDMGIYVTDIGYYIPYSIALADGVKITNQIDKTLSVEDKAADAKAVGNIFNAMNPPHIEKTYMLGGEDVVKDERLDLDDGTIVTNSSGQCRSNWIEAPTGTRVITTGVRYICLYDEEYTYLGYYNLYSDNAYTPETWSGNYATNLTQIQKVGNVDVKYIRYWGMYEVYNPALLVLNDDDYTIVNLGDSIFGNNEIPYDLGTQIQKCTWKKTANCGFGGTTARVIPTGNMAPLGLPSIVDCIVSKDYSSLGTPAEWASKQEYRYSTQTLLFPLIDFEKVKVITIAYGTNDWNSDTPLDNENNKFDTATYCGGLRYAIKELQTAYPNLTIVLFAPLYRYWSSSQDYSTVDDDSNTRTNSLNLKLTDYVTAMKGVAEEYSIPFFDNYHACGLNQFSAPNWLRDGTHLNRTVGVELIGHRMAGEIDTVY